MDAELETFQLLNPRRGRRYLNYGCGRWSSAMTRIRDQGYDVIGFDPYVADPGDHHVLNDYRLLSMMCFDGIMSHNLLEHLVDPQSSLTFMASMLRKGGVMAHSTECYEYKHEYSRFHLFFFVGDSLGVLSRNSGLQCTGAPGEYVRLFEPIGTIH